VIDDEDGIDVNPVASCSSTLPLILEHRPALANHNPRVASHPRAVERGTPRSVARVTSPVRWTSSRSRRS
jgi:hypothetical protein